MLNLLFHLVITTIVFLLYIQFSPGMGNIWYRNNEYFSPMGAVRVLLFPLQNAQMWLPNMWDLNYIIWVAITIAVSWAVIMLNISMRMVTDALAQFVHHS